MALIRVVGKLAGSLGHGAALGCPCGWYQLVLLDQVAFLVNHCRGDVQTCTVLREVKESGEWMKSATHNIPEASTKPEAQQLR